LNGAVTLQARFPARAEINLIRNGECIQSSRGEAVTFITNAPGVYRIEAYKHFLGKGEAGFFSNPIYIR